MKAIILAITIIIITLSIPGAFAETEYFVNEEITFTCPYNSNFTLLQIDKILGDRLPPETEQYRTPSIAYTPTSVGKYVLTCFAVPLQIGGYYTETFTVVIIPVCGYSTIPSLDYGTMVAGETKSVNLTPTVADTHIQPTSVTFSVSDWLRDTVTVVDNSKTTINGNSGADIITLSNVTANQSFAFETTLDFVSATEYIQSIGQTITQTTTLTPIVNS